jgi:2,4-dienoyl-CoA reductase-like NADH-dependent reductase (Old Yellow Enzyme family)
LRILNKTSTLSYKMSNLLQPVTLGDNIQLRNRVCMGSMTRNRCIDGNKPTDATTTHYAVRAKDGVGLIVAEGTFVYLNGSEWPHAPVMYNDSHADAWKPVTAAVHREGGKIFFQPWHPGEAYMLCVIIMQQSNGFNCTRPDSK